MKIYLVTWTAKFSLHARFMSSGEAFITASDFYAAENAVAARLSLQPAMIGDPGSIARVKALYTVDSVLLGDAAVVR